MPAGYSINPLYKKLGMKEGSIIKLINEPDNYKLLIGPFINKVSITKAKKGVDLIHFFVNELNKLEKELPVLMKEIKKNGIIWISWYKKVQGNPQN